MSRALVIFCILLLLPALYINLGLMTFIDDEAIRSLVTLEMDLRGNWIMPTLNGEPYYNKPPLFNWLLGGYFFLAGAADEWAARIATVASLLLYAGCIFLFTRRYLGNWVAFLNAFFFITCGRVLLWDSQLALIDITFSWLVFLGFMVVFHFYERKQWYALFILSYLLTSFAFLMKGLPALVFQGLTLLAWFIADKNGRRLFSWAHVAGVAVLLAVLSGYYFSYAQFNSLEEVGKTLFTESSKRTIANYGIGPTIQHLFTFPVEMIYHFLPWSILVIYLFRKSSWKDIWQNRFIRFCALTFAVNIVLYWTSVEVYPRYLLMHAPLLFTVLIYLHQQNQAANTRMFRGMTALLFLFCLFFFGLAFVPLFSDLAEDVPYALVKSTLLLIVIFALLLVFAMQKSYRVATTIAILLVVRIGFNWFVLPDRYQEDWGTMVKLSSQEVGYALADKETFYIYKATDCQPTNSFYITQSAQCILFRKYEGFEPGDYIIVDEQLYPKVKLEKIADLYLRYQKKSVSVGKYLGHE